MLAKSPKSVGFKYELKILLNGWTLSALLWCSGLSVEYIGNVIDVISFANAMGCLGYWIKFGGWAVGGLFVLIFAARLCLYFHRRRKGQFL